MSSFAFGISAASAGSFARTAWSPTVESVWACYVALRVAAVFLLSSMAKYINVTTTAIPHHLTISDSAGPGSSRCANLRKASNSPPEQRNVKFHLYIGSATTDPNFLFRLYRSDLRSRPVSLSRSAAGEWQLIGAKRT